MRGTILWWAILILWLGWIAVWTVYNPLPWRRKVIPVGCALLLVLIVVLAGARPPSP